MLNTAHIAETAILILAVFLIGCFAGYLARRLFAPGRVAAATPPAEAVTSAVAPLVTAPTIAPVAGARPRSAAERLAAAAGRADPGDGTPVPLAAPPADERRVTALPPAGEAKEAIMAMMGAVPPPEAAPAPTGEAVTPAPAAAQPETSAPSSIEPAHVAGEAISVAEAAPTSGSLATSDKPEAPAVVVDRDLEPVKADDVPPIDEQAHVVEPTSVSPESAPSSPATPEVARTSEATPAGDPDGRTAQDPVGVPQDVPPVPEAADPPPAKAAEPKAVPPVSEDTESAAMRAIEGGWTPPAASVPPRRPVPHPEHTTAEADTALAHARSAVAAARAAADAAVAEARGTATPEQPSMPAELVAVEDAGLIFEVPRETVPETFLDGSAPPDAGRDGTLNFEPATAPYGFGRPPALTEPRGGSKENLRQIKGVTPHLEQSLNALGIYHFDQIASWDQKAIVWVDGHLGLRGRIVREKWIDQARALAGGHNPTLRPVRR